MWLSEIMLQQTQVSAVIPYYERFLRRFPDVGTLAAASQDEVLKFWSGLGYYARGRNLHAAAQQIVAQKGFPETAEGIAELPGIGRSTAAAIAAFSFGERAAILDGNVKRVLARCNGIEGWPGERAVEARLWKLAEGLLPGKQIQVYTQALMDLGATLCTRTKPRCDACPVRSGCVARKKGLVGRIPAARPRKLLPEKSATWLLMVFGTDILLEKRPPTGLWGGLWTLPESSAADVAAECRRRFGCVIADARELEPIEHGFTHFHLHIRPLMCPVRSVTPLAESEGRMWTDIGEARGAAVPAPVRKLLKVLLSGSR